MVTVLMMKTVNKAWRMAAQNRQTKKNLQGKWKALTFPKCDNVIVKIQSGQPFRCFVCVDNQSYQILNRSKEIEISMIAN